MANWATRPLEALQRGEVVQIRPRGSSMSGRIESGQLVTIAPVSKVGLPSVGDVVLCKVNGKPWLHLVSAIGPGGRYQISNNRGHVNGWCIASSIFGVVTEVR